MSDRILACDRRMLNTPMQTEHNALTDCSDWAVARKYGPDLVVDLGRTREGFALHLTFEAAYELDLARRDALVPGLSRYEEDHDLDQYYRYFLPLTHYTEKQG